MTDYIRNFLGDVHYLLQYVRYGVKDQTSNTKEYQHIELHIEEQRKKNLNNFQNITDVILGDILTSKSLQRLPGHKDSPRERKLRKLSNPFVFERFLQLPYELRRHIWLCALEARYELGRMNAIEVTADRSELYGETSKLTLNANSTWDKVLPPLLKASRESRGIVHENFPHALPIGGAGGMLQFQGFLDIIHIASFEFQSPPESFVSFGSLSKPLRRRRGVCLPPHLTAIELLQLDFDGKGLFEEVFPADYLLLLFFFPNLRELRGSVRWSSDVAEKEIFEDALRGIEQKFPSFWEKVQRHYVVSEHFYVSKFRLEFQIQEMEEE